MTKSALLIICSIFAMSVFNSFQTSQSGQTHRQWLEEKYLEATSIKVGMTRADLLKIFEPDGGLQRLLPERYVLKDSGMIKVDVKFDVPEDYKTAPKIVPDEKLKIKSISKPYLELFTTD